VTDFRQSQSVLEVWVADQTAARVSQVQAEAWVQNQPPTSFVVSQAALEAWETMTVPIVKFTVSQVALEVWRTTADAPAVRRVSVSSQVV
jgi:hypothetical protein